MSVDTENQVWFPWKRCRDGYKIREDDAGALWIHPLSTNSEEITPLDDAALFRRFANLDAGDFEAVLGFVNDTGLNSSALEPDPMGLWEVEIRKLSKAVDEWRRWDIDNLVVRFNDLNMAGAFNLRLGPQPRRSPPILFIEPRELFHALWAQFAHAVSRNETQRQCDYCHRWYPPLTKRSQFCSDKCRMAKSYRSHKSKQSMKKEKKS